MINIEFEASSSLIYAPSRFGNISAEHQYLIFDLRLQKAYKALDFYEII